MLRGRRTGEVTVLVAVTPESRSWYFDCWFFLIYIFTFLLFACGDEEGVKGEGGRWGLVWFSNCHLVSFCICDEFSYLTTSNGLMERNSVETMSNQTVFMFNGPRKKVNAT